MTTANPFASFDLWAALAGGLALFLFGLDSMGQALKSAAGNRVKNMLGSLTRNRLVGAGAGAFVTAVVQSSSVTTVVLVGFIAAGLMTMSQSVAVILGANIGTAFTVQVLAFHVSRIALPLIALGFGIAFTARRNEWRQVGMAVMALGMVFFGMSIMSAGLGPLETYEPYVHFMTGLRNPLPAMAMGAVFTALVQSSAATIGILIVMASQGLIGLETAIAITLGANIGTCITALLASIGKPREAVRAAAVHVLFNVAGVAIWIGIIPVLAEAARWTSPVHPGLAEAERLAADMPRQIANAQLIFNLANVLLFIGFTNRIARLVEWLIPDRPQQPDEAMAPRYLDTALLSTPSIALKAARLEVGRLGDRVSDMVAAVMPGAITGTSAELEETAAMDGAVDSLHMAIVEFLGKVSVSKLTPQQSGELMQLVEIANDLEHIGDDIATNLVTSARKRIAEDVRISQQTARFLAEYHQFVVSALNDTLRAITDEDAALARQVSHRKKTFIELSHRLAQHGLDRLTANEPNRLKTYVRETEVMEILDGVFTIVRRMARSQYKTVEQDAAAS